LNTLPEHANGTLNESTLIAQITGGLLEPIAEAHAIQELIKLRGGSMRSASSRLKWTAATIKEKLRILELADEVKQFIQQEKVSPAVIQELTKLSDTNDQLAMLEWYVKDQRTQNDVAKPDDGLHAWALSGVIVMAVLSSLLNGFANSQHAEIYWAAWAMGLVIPLIVFILGKVAGLLWKRGNAKLAYAVGGTGVCLLFLSVFHCSQSICLLTGSQWFLGLPLAIAIDCGLVTCEIAAIVED